MPKFFRFPFAVSGQRDAVRDDESPTGVVNYQQGFGVDYSRNPATDPATKRVPRQQFNQLLYDATDALRQYQTMGVPDFITSADNGGTPFLYARNARVRHNGSIWESRVDLNGTIPSISTQLYWRMLNLGALDTTISIQSSLTMSRDYANKLSVIENLGGNINVVLPNRSDFIAGETLYFQNISSFTANILRAGLNTINFSGTSIQVGAGDTLTLVASYADTVWLTSGGSSALRFSQGAFRNSYSAGSGFRFLPTGEIEQYGISGAVNAGGSVSVTFPLAFPNACVGVFATPIGAGVNSNSLEIGVARTLTGATLYNWGSAINLTSGVMWRALGY